MLLISKCLINYIQPTSQEKLGCDGSGLRGDGGDGGSGGVGERPKHAAFVWSSCVVAAPSLMNRFAETCGKVHHL